MLSSKVYKNLNPTPRIFLLDKENPKFGISSFVSLKVTFGLYFLQISATSLTVRVSLVKLKISELVHILENHIKPYAMASSDVLNLFVTSREKDTAEFEFPIQYLKLLTHHTIQHNLKKYQTKELKFDIHKGLKTLSMQQIKISVFIISDFDLPEADVSKLNREMSKKIDLTLGDNHTSFIRILLRGMSGSFEAYSMGKTARYEISFWVDI